MNFLFFNQYRHEVCKFKGGSQKTETTSVSTPHQQGNYDKLLGGADSWLANGGYDKSFGGSADFGNGVAGQTAGQTAGINGLNQTGGALQNLFDGQGIDSLSNYLGKYDPSKTGLNAAIGAANEQSNWDFDTQVRPELRQGAVASGQYGSSRAGIAEGIATSRLTQQQQNNASQMAMTDQQNFNNNQSQVLQNLTSISKGLGSGSGMQYDAGTMQQQQDQLQKNGDLQKWAYENNADLNDLMAYQQLISGDMGGTNMSTTKGPAASGGGGGAAIGSIAGGIAGSFFGPMGTMAGSYLGGAVGGAV